MFGPRTRAVFVTRLRVGEQLLSVFLLRTCSCGILFKFKYFGMTKLQNKSIPAQRYDKKINST